MMFNHIVCGLREHIPLKQGLRRRYVAGFHPPAPLREHIPLKQGLRQELPFLNHVICLGLREHIPLKQGLRLFAGHCFRF